MDGKAHLTDRQAQLLIYAIEDTLGLVQFSGEWNPNDRRRLFHARRELERLRANILDRQIRSGLRSPVQTKKGAA